ncbi:hypothetical protein [Sphingomonas immobilis]|uniref:DUF1190 domain-containing protein n=1 Tax=Sphingomonas immobilis TaxID=3063997 RepID=A0ABT9A1I1_9SPHN|nr:hypothetical protein [Sphingomonas sp. CA1-15]MDO7843687.1 hypothetical protein [Sphingomonas sp. CA1-15]
MKFDLKLTTAISAALIAGACSNDQGDWTAQRDTAVCTDKAGQRVADANCQRAHSGSSGVMAGAFAWYYLSRNSRVPYYGERATGGSFARAAGSTYYHAPAGTAMTRSAAISRGGFGSSARSFGGFGE